MSKILHKDNVRGTRFYFTFGNNTNLKNNYVVIFTNSEDDAREQMRKQYKSNWAFCYNEREFSPQPATYGLTMVNFGTPCIKES